MTRSEEMRRMAADRKKMEAAGWSYNGSVMSGDKGDKNYGIMFWKKDHPTFYYNRETRDNLPIPAPAGDSVPEKHRKKIARENANMPDPIRDVMNG